MKILLLVLCVIFMKILLLALFTLFIIYNFVKNVLGEMLIDVKEMINVAK